MVLKTPTNKQENPHPQKNLHKKEIKRITA